MKCFTNWEKKILQITCLGTPSREAHVVTESAQQHVNPILNQSKPKARSLVEIAEATASDDTLQCVLKFIENDRWNLDTLPFPDTDINALKIMKLIKHEFASADGKWLLRDSRIVMPSELQERVIELAHEGHQGKVKTKRLLRSKVWFPFMNSKCKKLVDQCLLCQAATPQNVREPLQMSKLPEEAWKNVSIGFCEIGNEYALVITDEYSRYPIVEIMSSTSSNSVIPKLDSVFSMLGVPKVVKTDNGLPFNGDKFRQFAEYMGFKYRKITPFWPEANAEAERFVRTFKRCYTHQNTGNKTCFHFLEITEQLPIAPLATRLQLHFWVEKNNSMITAKSDNKTVTRNSSHFKKANVAERKGEEINERASHSTVMNERIPPNNRTSLQHTVCEYELERNKARKSKRVITPPTRLLEQMQTLQYPWLIHAAHA